MVHPAPDDFDAFYVDARHRLLLQTYALTGDLRASRSAVRNAFVVAWHHWPRASRSEHPEGWVRPYAWRHARRRHTARLWHRTRGLDEEARATLAALGALSLTQRRLLLLAHLANVSMGGMAREVALPRETAERELQRASSAFAAERGVPATGVRVALERLDTVVAEEPWPQPLLLRRAGNARRRTHTAAGMVGAVAALAVAGVVVVGQEPGDVRPTLESERLTEPAELPPEASLDPDDLLDAQQARQLLPGRRWRTRDEGDNTSGTGLVVRCQQERFADPVGSAAVRRFAAVRARNQPRASGVQLAELSSNQPAARRAFATTAQWYAGCAEPATRLASTHTLPRIGDQASLFVLRSYRPTAVTTVGVARSGRFTHTVARTVRGGSAAGTQRVAAVLADAVDANCGQPGAGSCAGIPYVEPRGPYAVPPAPALLAEFDLPAVSGVPRPWVGTEPTRAKVNPAATPCDETSFRGRPGNRTRTFLIPEARVPDAFGLAESTARFQSPGRARAFVRQLRGRLARCPRDDPASEVRGLASSSGGGRQLFAWKVSTEVSDARSVRYLMAVVRTGPVVAQVGFVPAGDRTISVSDFRRLARRAQQRLAFAVPDRDEGAERQEADRKQQPGNQGSGNQNSGS